MTIKQAMSSYFTKLETLYMKKFGTAPTVCYDEENQELFFGKPDDDYEIQWKTAEAEKISVAGLCGELTEFYSSYYYRAFRGYTGSIQLYFPAVYSKSMAEKLAKLALDYGEYYFPGRKTALLADCYIEERDGLMMFYRQDCGKIFVYDPDRDTIMELEFSSLAELIYSLEAII